MSIVAVLAEFGRSVTPRRSTGGTQSSSIYSKIACAFLGKADGSTFAGASWTPFGIDAGLTLSSIERRSTAQTISSSVESVTTFSMSVACGCTTIIAI